MTTSRDLPDVVGVDGSEAALDAVRWAVRDVAGRGRPLRLVAAVPGTPVTTGARARAWDDRRKAAVAAAEENLRVAAAVATDTLPLGAVGTALREGTPAQVLAEESQRAATVVVGHRGRGGFRGLLLGSTGVSLAATAGCPLVVVRGSAPATGPVVVGVDGSGDAAAALDFAADVAARREVPLVAVRAWCDPATDPAVALLLDPEAVEREEAEELERAVAPLSEEFPTVEVRTRVVHGSPSAVLTGASDGAGLVVVGTRGRGPLSGLVLGSVAQAVLHHAGAPVAVVRDGAPPNR
ncbi:universal stress protein [Pseudonocardia sp. ICBG162]|nr:universal stress protein [Pseudonocardia sp. ICBG162]